MPQWLDSGLQYTSGVLPALGFGMLLLMIGSAEFWPFFHRFPGGRVYED